MSTTQPLVMEARGLVKRYGQVTALDGTDFELRAGEILAVIGDNGAGKSSLIKALSGATIPDEGEIKLDGKVIHFKSPADARREGIETVYQDLAVAPAMSISENLFLGREIIKSGFISKLLRIIDKKQMLEQSVARMNDLKVGIRSMTQAVETLSGGQRQCVAVSRAAAFAQHVVILDRSTRRQRGQHGARADPPRARQGPAGDPDQPQHAACVRDRRPHPRRASRQALLRRQPEDDQHERHRRGDDRRDAARPVAGRLPRLTGRRC
jgi:ABC-type branched-subunit amino acid transport system ATPase component